MAKKKKNPDCFNAGVAVTHLLGELFEASESAKYRTGNLSESAKLAREIGKMVNGPSKRKATALARRASKLARLPERKRKVTKINELRMKARQLKSEMAKACRTVPLL